jgi:hypothetical protein
MKDHLEYEIAYLHTLVDYAIKDFEVLSRESGSKLERVQEQLTPEEGEYRTPL